MKKVWMILTLIAIMGIPAIAFGAPAGTELLDNLFKWICVWVGRIGMIVAFIGAVQFAIGWISHNPESRVSGLTTAMAGFMTIGISKAPHLFGF